MGAIRSLVAYQGKRGALLAVRELSMAERLAALKVKLCTPTLRETPTEPVFPGMRK
jgi:hypothetical protein